MPNLFGPDKTQEKSAQPASPHGAPGESLENSPVVYREPTTTLPPPAMAACLNHAIRDENEFIEALESVGFQVEMTSSDQEPISLMLGNGRRIIVTNSFEGQGLPHPFYGTKAGLLGAGTNDDLIATVDSADGLCLDEIFNTIRLWMESNQVQAGL